MIGWLKELNENIRAEYACKPATATLATVMLAAGGPRADARTVVVRQVLEDGSLLITSDARSQKNQQLKLNPSAVAVLWLPSLRKQFRLDGNVSVLGEADFYRKLIWREASDTARALFLWPPAGEVREEQDELWFPKTAPISQPLPESFEVLQLLPRHLDILDLNLHPHLRTQWRFEDGNWNAAVVNP